MQQVKCPGVGIGLGKATHPGFIQMKICGLNFSITLIYFNELYFWRGASPHSTICQLTDLNGKRVPFSHLLRHSSGIQADWSNLGPLLNCSALISLGWGVGSGPSESLVCYKSVDILKENWGVLTRMLNAGKAKTDTRWRRSGGPHKLYITTCKEILPQIPQTRSPLTLYRFILISFPSIVFYNKLSDKLREQMENPPPTLLPVSHRRLAPDFIHLCPRLERGSNFA